MELSKDIFYVGVDDHLTDLFEGLYPLKNGVSYNSYVIIDEKIAVLDTVCEACGYDFEAEWLQNVEKVLDKKTPNYLIVSHMEPDHSSAIVNFVAKYPECIVVGNKKTFVMIDEFYPQIVKNRLEVGEGYLLSLGKHSLKFILAPMVHWPEVMVCYDAYSKVLFSADAFGKFGALDSTTIDDWLNEARRYYIGIVGKYGPQVVSLLKKATALDIKAIYPLHGPMLEENLCYYIEKYKLWSTYTPENNDVVIVYSSVYGHTANASQILKENVEALGVKCHIFDLCRCDKYEALSYAFSSKSLVLAAPTYNADIFPPTREFINLLLERNFQNRKVGFIENGTWAPISAKLMREKFEKSKNLTFLSTATLHSSISEKTISQLCDLSKELI